MGHRAPAHLTDEAAEAQSGEDCSSGHGANGQLLGVPGLFKQGERNLGNSLDIE